MKAFRLIAQVGFVTLLEFLSLLGVSAHMLLLGRIMTQPVFRIKDIAKLFQLSVPSLPSCKTGFLCTDLEAKHKFLGLEVLRTEVCTKMENVSW